VISREVDFPPIWLAGFAALGGAVTFIWPTDIRYASETGAVLIILALMIFVVAVLQMMFRRTTVVPHRVPSRMVTGGIFRFSRNPIYLADTLFLAGLYFYWGALIALPLVAVFMEVIRRRFILDEEQRLHEAFGPEYEAYAARTRRWI
jgi:protein-S-isoprenylcysteine O-methyltransferase Ste14